MSGYSYGLIVKGCTNDTAPDVRRRLAGLAGARIVETTDWPASGESHYLVTAGQDLTNVLNEWFTDDFTAGRPDAPFPIGSLLYWRPCSFDAACSS